ncbi:MAG: TRAP transporter small permease [Pigmentiphaga sp.]
MSEHLDSGRTGGGAPRQPAPAPPAPWLETAAQRLAAGLALLASTALFALMTLTFVDVMARKFYRSVPGTLEVSEMLLVVVLFCALPLVSWRGGHVSFELADALYKGRMARYSSMAMDLISAAALGGLGWFGWGNAARTLQDGDVSVYLRVPLGYFVYLMAAMLMLAALLHLIRALTPRPL